MFSNKKKVTPSIIAADVTLVGQVKSAGEVHLEGKVTGDVRVESLTIGLQGAVDGQVFANDIVIKGTVNGAVTAKNVVIEKTAKVMGDVFHETLSIAAGADIEGNIKHQVAAPPESQKVTKMEGKPQKKASS